MFSTVDLQEADVVLVSGETATSASVEFRAHKAILISASPFFQSLFGLPQPELAPLTPPLIPMSEPSAIIGSLLQFIYPVPDPELSSLSEIAPVLEAASKYDLNAVVSRLGKLLSEPRFAENEPTRVYAMATRYGLEDLAKLASTHTLTLNVLDCPLSEELRHITAYDYHRLLDLHRQRARSAQNVMQILPPDNVKCMQCNGTTYSAFLHPKWWTEFQKRAAEHLALRPTSDVVFGLRFLAEVANATGCTRCPQSILESHAFLQSLKDRIDALPQTI